MGAFIIDGIDGVLHFEKRNELTTSLYHFAVTARNFSQRADPDPLLCHTCLLKEQPGVVTPTPLAKDAIEPLCLPLPTAARDETTVRW
jgi:hypothetical protein